ncbi:MAG: family 20 glycosylhydrolase [Deltaproteobacteria bacterium]|nr:MAG: family 20 glycosylhydrolase [Deltaproteobacteria bacterium]
MSPASPSTALPPLLPAPRRVRARPGAFALRDGLPIALRPGADDAAVRAARALRDAVRAACGVELAIEGHARTDELGPRVELQHGSAAGKLGDGYRLDVEPTRIAAEAGGPAGLRYAVETLSQLLRKSGRVPACSIDDEPDFEMRGLMLDVSRGKVPTPATLRQIVDLCVHLKQNALMLYTEHTFRFRRHPEIGADASPLDAETLRTLAGYAAERHVDLIPSLQTLGHMRHILKLPRYAHLAETDARWTIAPVDPGTYELLADLLDEYLPNFRSRWFNANCDEPFDLGRGRSGLRDEQLGPGGVYLEHVERVREMARAHNKRTLIWGDVVHAHPERIRDLNRELVLLDWWYEAQHDFDRVRVFAEHGIAFLVCPGTSTWNSLFPRLENSLENIARYADSGRRHGALGVVTTDWGDHGHYNLLGNSWFAYAFSAQQSWSGDPQPGAFDRAFSRELFGDASGEAAKLYRALGELHDVGMPSVMNASPLQLIYFDDPGPAHAIAHARVRALRRTQRKLERVRERVARARERFAREPGTHEELLFAADASLLATRKGLAGLAYLDWRRRPTRLDARARRRLARELGALADAQRALRRRLRKLWLARSAASNFEITGRRYDVSIRGLRRAARALEANRPPKPPPRVERFDGRAFQNLFERRGVRSGSAI